MRKIIFYLVLSLAAAGCSEATSSFKATNGPSSESPEEGALSDPMKACYPGLEKNAPKCWQTHPVKDLSPSQAKLYVYADPLTDPTFPDGFDKTQYAAPTKLLNLQSINIREWLSPSFMRIELMPSNVARGIYGLFSRNALARIQAMRDELDQPIVVTSGFRSPGHNSTLAGAAKWSRHTYGDAIDFAAEGTSFSDMARICMKHGASFYQIYKGHIHCDWRGQALDPAFHDQGAAVPGPAHHAPSPSMESAIGAVKRSARIIEPQRVQAKSNSTLQLATQVFQEDGGELAHNWEVLHPNGQVSYSTKTELNLALPPGTYQVRVNVGGSIDLDGEFRVNP